MAIGRTRPCRCDSSRPPVPTSSTATSRRRGWQRIWRRCSPPVHLHDAPRNTRMSARSLFKETLTVVNVGLKGFGEDIVAAGGQCVALDWQPPAQGDREGGWALAEILNHPAVEAANATALARFIAANPVLTDVAPARDVLIGMAGGRRLIVHAGPPIAWPQMCGPMRGAVLGAVLLEGWADS